MRLQHLLLLSLLLGAEPRLFAQHTTHAVLEVQQTFTAKQTFLEVDTSGINGGWWGPEGNGSAMPAPGAGLDLLYPDSALHCWHLNANNVDGGCAVGDVSEGTTTLTSGTVGSNTCQTTVTTSAAGVTGADVVSWSYASAPATADALLKVSQYTNSGNVGFTRCNTTSASQTGTAIVINWKVVR